MNINRVYFNFEDKRIKGFGREEENCIRYALSRIMFWIKAHFGERNYTLNVENVSFQYLDTSKEPLKFMAPPSNAY